MIATLFKDVDLVALTTAIGIAVPAILGAISSFRNGRRIKRHDEKFDQAATQIADIDKRVNGR